MTLVFVRAVAVMIVSGASGVFPAVAIGKVFRQHQLGADFLQNVINRVERGADEMQAEAAGLDDIERARGNFVRLELHPVIAQPEANGVFQSLARKADHVGFFEIVSVADDVRAGLVNAENDHLGVVFRKLRVARKLPHDVSHHPEICRMAGELDFVFHRFGKN